MDVDLRDVRHFVELADCLSFTQAALNLRISQPKLSLSIRDWESRLGFRLFDRSSRVVRLTAQGERMLEEAKRLLDQSDALSQLGREIALEKKISLRVGVVDYFPNLRRGILQDYTMKNPEIGLDIDMVRQEDAAGVLGRDFVDCAFLLQFGDDPVLQNLDRVKLITQKMGLLLPADSPLAACRMIAPSALPELQIALFRRDLFPFLHDGIIGFLSQHKPKMTNLPEATLAGMIDCVREQRMAVACVRWWQTDSEAPAGIVHRQVEGFDLDMSFVLARRHGAASPANNELWRIAQRRARQTSIAEPSIYSNL